MIYLYKKVDKTKNNTYGFTEIKGINDLNRPFLLCLSGKNNYDKYIFGVMRAGLQAARGYTTQEVAAGFELNALPFDVLGLSFKKDNKYENDYDEIAERLFSLFLLKEGNDNDKILKQARMINVFTFDEGASVYKNVEVRLKSILVDKGVSKDKVVDILSQISVISLGTSAHLDDICATCTIFNDVNDVRITNNLVDENRRVLEKMNANLMYHLHGSGNNCVYFSFLGNGVHGLKSYLSNDCVAKPAICAVVANSLENSLINMFQKSLYKIDVDVTLNVLYYYGVESCPVENLIETLEKNISYCESYRYSENEANLRKQLDYTYKLLRKNRRLVVKEKEIKTVSNYRLNNIIKGTRKYSSNITYHQILTDAGLWMGSKDILDKVSDKDVRIKYDKLPKNVKSGTVAKKNASKKSLPKKSELKENKKATNKKDSKTTKAKSKAKKKASK